MKFSKKPISVCREGSSSAKPDSVWSRNTFAQTLQGLANSQKPGCKRLQVLAHIQAMLQSLAGFCYCRQNFTKTYQRLQQRNLAEQNLIVFGVETLDETLQGFANTQKPGCKRLQVFANAHTTGYKRLQVNSFSLTCAYSKEKINEWPKKVKKFINIVIQGYQVSIKRGSWTMPVM